MQTMMTFGLFLSFEALCLNPKFVTGMYKNCVAISRMYVYSIMHTRYYLIAYSSAHSSEKGDLCWVKCSKICPFLENTSVGRWYCFS